MDELVVVELVHRSLGRARFNRILARSARALRTFSAARNRTPTPLKKMTGTDVNSR